MYLVPINTDPTSNHGNTKTNRTLLLSFFSMSLTRFCMLKCKGEATHLCFWGLTLKSSTWPYLGGHLFYQPINLKNILVVMIFLNVNRNFDFDHVVDSFLPYDSLNHSIIISKRYIIFFNNFEITRDIYTK